MQDIRACVACLCTDARMYSVNTSGLTQAYQLLTGLKTQETAGMPRYLCWECGAIVHKYCRFRERCHRAYALLRNIYISCDEITLEKVLQIDRESDSIKLCSPNTLSSVYLVSVDSDTASTAQTLPNEQEGCVDNTDQFVGVQKGEINEIMKLDEIKDEVLDIEFFENVADRSSDSDDDKPLRLPKGDRPVKKRKKRKKDGDGKCKRVKVDEIKKDLEGDTVGYKVELMTKEEQLEEIRMRRLSSTYKKCQYKCTVCYKAYNRKDRYHNHMLLHDPVSGDFECEICKVRMCSDDALGEHIKKNHTKKYTCTHCGHISINQNTAALHARGHLPASLTTTAYLEKLQATAVKISREEQLKVFRERRQSEEYLHAKFRCKICCHVSRRREGYDRHKRRHDPTISGSIECDICRQLFKTRQAATVHQMKCHMKKYTCRLCEHVSYSLSEAKGHCDWHKAGCKVKKVKVKKEAAEQSGELVETMIIEDLTQEEQASHFRASRASDAPYKCWVCLKGHYDSKAFSNHLRKHEPVSGKFQCDICKYRYKSRYDIQRHLVYFHKSRYRCKICAEIFHNRMAATKHHLWHKGKVYECPHCGLQSNILSSHLTHLRLKHPSEHVCVACGEAFVSSLGLQQHRRITHTLASHAEPAAGAQTDERPAGAHCAACDLQFLSAAAWTRHILISPKHQHEKHSIVNGCRECGASYATASELKAHRSAAHARRVQRPRRRDAGKREPRPCAQCGEMMANPREYWTHFRRAHPGETYPLEVPMSQICEHCGKGFRCHALLAIHRHVHTGERRYACQLCPKRFFNPLNLKNHLVSHSERRPHVCRVCRKGFKFKSALDRHMRTHTGVKPYTCEVCNKAFSDSSSRRLHVRAVHAREPPPASERRPRAMLL